MKANDFSGVDVRVEGHVQGVGYRYFAMEKALALGITGWVRNRPDGGVEELSSTAFAVQLNHLKLSASELVAEICTKALRITGTTGYRNDSPYSVTRNLRDAHSAALMIGNERIHASNGTLHLMYRDEAL